MDDELAANMMVGGAAGVGPANISSASPMSTAPLPADPSAAAPPPSNASLSTDLAGGASHNAGPAPTPATATAAAVPTSAATAAAAAAVPHVNSAPHARPSTANPRSATAAAGAPPPASEAGTSSTSSSCDNRSGNSKLQPSGTTAHCAGEASGSGSGDECDNLVDLAAFHHGCGLTNSDWTPDEQVRLEELMGRYPPERYGSTERTLQIAAQLTGKTARDVAMRMSWVAAQQEHNKKRKSFDDASTLKRRSAAAASLLPSARAGAGGGGDVAAAAAAGGGDGADTILPLMEANYDILSQYKANMQALKVMENTELLMKYRDNLIAVLQQLNALPGVLGQRMPALPVQLNLDLANKFLPSAKAPPPPHAMPAPPHPGMMAMMPHMPFGVMPAGGVPPGVPPGVVSGDPSTSMFGPMGAGRPPMGIPPPMHMAAMGTNGGGPMVAMMPQSMPPGAMMLPGLMHGLGMNPSSSGMVQPGSSSGMVHAAVSNNHGGGGGGGMDAGGGAAGGVMMPRPQRLMGTNGAPPLQPQAAAGGASGGQASIGGGAKEEAKV